MYKCNVNIFVCMYTYTNTYMHASIHVYGCYATKVQ